MSAIVGAERGLSQKADFVLREYGKTEYLDSEEFPQAAREVVEKEINVNSDGKNATRLALEYNSDGDARICATQYVGIVSLPEGLTIEVRPKIKDADLLGLLQYAQGATAQTYDRETSVSGGTRFIDALATLFEAELNDILSRGLHQEYRRVSETTEHIRGRLDVSRQLQRQGPTPTAFECTYDELTVDTTVNRSILYATTILQRFVQDPALNSSLTRHRQRLRRRIELTPVRPVELEAVELNRLAEYYADIVRLTKLILRSTYIDDLHAADRDSYALLVNMNTVFEKVVERALSEFATSRGWKFTDQASSGRLFVGDGPVSIRPDVLLSDETGSDRLVGDAKWKRNDPDNNSKEPSPADIYQLVSYEVAHNTPGVLFYPSQNHSIESDYEVFGLDSLSIVEVPVKPTGDRTLSETIAVRIENRLLDCLKPV